MNPYYEVIVRLPTDEEPTEIPVGLVSRNYQLIQHHEILQRAAALLASNGVDLAKVFDLVETLVEIQIPAPECLSVFTVRVEDNNRCV